MSTATKVSPNELAAVRDEVTRLRTEHKKAHGDAMSQLKARQKAIAEGEASALVDAETVEMFASADTLAEELDKATSVEAAMLRSRFGADPADGPTAAQAARRGDRFDSIADRAMKNTEFMAAFARGRDGIRGRAFDVLDAADTAHLLKTGTLRAAQLDGTPLIGDDQSRLSDPYRLPLRMPDLLSILPSGTTESDLVKYVRKTTNTPGISGQPAGTPFTEATYVYTPASAEVVSRGAMLPVPEDNLSDVGRLRAVLDGDMVADNRRDLEDQVINGAGTAGTDMRGILNTAGIGSLTRNSGESLADAVHRVITSIRTTAFVEPDWLAYTAADWEVLALEKASDGHYVNSGGIFSPIPFTMWGIGSILGHVLPANTLLGGRFAETEVVVREGIKITEYQGEVAASEQLVYLRGKYRAAFIVKVPQSFTALDTTAVI